MADRPAQLWKDMPLDKRTRAAEAFWRDTESPDIQAQHVEALVAIAKRLNFRLKSVQALPIERRARHLAQMSDVSDLVASRALVAYHFAAERPLMSAFLDALAIEHDNGLITAEQVTPPESDRLQTAVETVRASFPADDLDLYVRTLLALDGDTWGNLTGVLQPRA
jgi:hypothetical protein